VRIACVIFATLILCATSHASDEVAMRGSLRHEHHWLKVRPEAPINIGNRIWRQDANADITRVRSVVSYYLTDEPQIAATARIYGAYYSDPVAEQNDAGTEYETDFTEFRFDELYADAGVTDRLYLLVGKKRNGWGPGFFFNPANLIDPPKDPSEPELIEEGRPEVMFAFVGESLELNLLYLRDINKTYHLQNNYGAARLAAIIGPVDFALIAYAGEETLPSYGAYFSTTFDDFLLYGEGAFTGECDSCYYYDYGGSWQRQKGSWVRGLLGVSYSFGAMHSLSLDWYHNNAGYGNDRRELYLLRLENLSSDIGQYLRQPETVISDPLIALFAAQKKKQLEDEYTLAAGQYEIGRLNYNYLIGSLRLMEFYDRLDISLYAIMAQDVSAMLIPSAYLRLGGHWSVYIDYSRYHGRTDTEFGSQPQRWVARGRVGIDF
jgi:hypothetical protein